jgi:LemA protein
MNRRKLTTYAIIGAVVVVLAIWATSTANRLIRKEENVKAKWGEVQNTYQRRLDLIPNLVSVVKGVSEFEQGTLEQIALARSNAQSVQSDSISAGNYQRQRQLQDSLAARANRVIVMIENYPVLKGTQAYSGLQTQLAGTERRIVIARRDFNAAVADYNKSVRSFPTNLLAGMMGFKKLDGFEADAGTEKATTINLK